MKTSIKTMMDSHIRDNKHFIKSYSEDGDIYEYLAADFANLDQGHVWYLTDDECVLWDTNEAERERLTREIWSFIEQYKGVSIDTYMNDTIEPAY